MFARRKLKSQDVEARSAAARERGSSGHPAAGQLVAALSDEDSSARREAAQALGKLGDATAVEPLIAALADKNFAVRRSAATALGQLGWEPGNDLQRAQRAIAAQDWDEAAGLGPAAVEPLIAALGNVNVSVVAGAARALGKLGDRRAVEPLIAVLGSSDSYPRCQAANALGELGDRRAVRPLIAALDDSHVREAAGEALLAIGRLGEGEVAPLISALGDQSWLIRREAAKVLEQLGWEPGNDLQRAQRAIAAQDWKEAAGLGPAAVEPLITVLSYHSVGAQDAASALGNLGDQRAVEPLMAALADRGASQYLRQAAGYALGKLGDARAVEPLMAVLREPGLGAAAATALGRLGSTRAVDPLSAALSDGDESVRRAAAEALGCIGDSRSTEPLSAAMADDDSRVRAEVAKALVKLGWRPEQPAGAVGVPGARQPDGQPPLEAFAALTDDEHQARQHAIALLLSSGYQDPQDARDCAVLGRSPGMQYSRPELAEDVKKYPDFDVAYIQAAYPPGRSDDHSHADRSLLLEGLIRCTVRSRLLARLSIFHSMWTRNELYALDYAVAAVAIGTPSAGSWDSVVEVLPFLAAAFDHAGLRDDAELARKVRAEYAAGPNEAAAGTAAHGAGIRQTARQNTARICRPIRTGEPYFCPACGSANQQLREYETAGGRDVLTGWSKCGADGTRYMVLSRLGIIWAPQAGDPVRFAVQGHGTVTGQVVRVHGQTLDMYALAGQVPGPASQLFTQVAAVVDPVMTPETTAAVSAETAALAVEVEAASLARNNAGDVRWAADAVREKLLQTLQTRAQESRV